MTINPCPYCKSKSVEASQHNGFATIRCLDCGCSTTYKDINLTPDDTLKKLIERWNNNG